MSNTRSENVWEAVNSKGKVVGTWWMRTYTLVQVKAFRDEWHPGTRLRERRMIEKTAWVEEAPK